jgi:hypothetical protein
MINLMVRTGISQVAFTAICATLPLGSVGYENKVDDKGQRWSGWRVPASRARVKTAGDRDPARRHAQVAVVPPTARLEAV